MSQPQSNTPANGPPNPLDIPFLHDLPTMNGEIRGTVVGFHPLPPKGPAMELFINGLGTGWIKGNTLYAAQHHGLDKDIRIAVTYEIKDRLRIVTDYRVLRPEDQTQAVRAAYGGVLSGFT